MPASIFQEFACEDRLNHELLTLSYWRLRGDMIEVYRIIKGTCDKGAAYLLKMWSKIAQRDKRGHNAKIYVHRGAKSLRQRV